MPRDPIDRLRGEMEELFADLWQVPRFTRRHGGFRPQVDCYRTERPAAIHVVAELPGVDPSKVQIFADERIWTGYRNTVLYTVVGTALNMFVTLPAAFALSRREFRPRRALMLFFAFTMFFSGGLIPQYLLYRDIGLLDNWLVFILPTALNV